VLSERGLVDALRDHAGSIACERGGMTVVAGSIDPRVSEEIETGRGIRLTVRDDGTGLRHDVVQPRRGPALRTALDAGACRRAPRVADDHLGRRRRDDRGGRHPARDELTMIPGWTRVGRNPVTVAV
jgi:hypothetical protein